MSTVTVCIPAYHVGNHLSDTVQSVLQQTYEDFRVVIGVDPPEDGRPDPLHDLVPFLCEDPRVKAVWRTRRLGWAGNTAELVTSVDTPWYAILPHDDLWHPRYLERLMGEAVAKDAVVAYADLVTFGVVPPYRKSVDLPGNESRAEHLLRFCLQGMEAMPWRGVTRSDTRAYTNGFAVDAHGGFAVECEYALQLLASGPVVQVPEPLYIKRLHPYGVASASRARNQAHTPESLTEVWKNHAGKMRLGMERALEDVRPIPEMDVLIRSALETALIRRWQVVSSDPLPVELCATLITIKEEVQRAQSGIWRKRTEAQVHLALSRDAEMHGKSEVALSEAQQAWELDPVGSEISLHMARVLARK